MSNALLGYLLLCAGIGILFAGALEGRPIVERVSVGFAFGMIVAGIGLLVSGMAS